MINSTNFITENKVPNSMNTLHDRRKIVILITAGLHIISDFFVSQKCDLCLKIAEKSRFMTFFFFLKQYLKKFMYNKDFFSTVLQF